MPRAARASPDASRWVTLERSALGQHAARGARQSRRVAMGDAGALPAGRFQNFQTLTLEAVAGFTRTLVPDLAGIVLLEARAGVDDQERADTIRMGAVERQRHVAAKREPADDRLVGADGVEQRRHVADRQRFAIGRGIIGVVGLAVAPHVPQHELVMLRQGRDLALPHPTGRRITVCQ